MHTGPHIGTHVSAAGGLHRGIERGLRIGCTTIQVFTKNSNRWDAGPIADEDIQNYKTAQGNATIAPVVAHAAYLINLCAASPAVLRRSRAALADELQRCEAFGLTGLVVHPGAHMGKGENEGIPRIAESINIVHENTPHFQTLTILETTAGQGTSVGYRFEQLRRIIDTIEQNDRVAVCIDTCHLFAAGYPIHTEAGWYATMREFDDILGFSRLALVHVNDSRRKLGSRVDRHEHIGKGEIGAEGFRMLMNDPRFRALPKILETEKSEDMHEDIENMAVLRSLVRTGELGSSP
jgi:deoxyribonuclease-4